MTRMKIRDRENRKLLTGFRDMANFVTGKRDPRPSFWASFYLVIKFFTLAKFFLQKIHYQFRNTKTFLSSRESKEKICLENCTLSSRNIVFTYLSSVMKAYTTLKEIC